jgi:lipopolysaccharide/colanic/teichoic acid biosynthesis glycosyltransferase
VLNAVAGILAGALPSVALDERRAPGNRRQARSEPKGRTLRRRRGRPHVLDQHLFRTALDRERRRAERFEQPFLLLLLALPTERGALGPSVVQRIVDALSAAKRPTDIVGWVERGAMLGLILPEVESVGAGIAGDLEARVRRELAQRLDEEIADLISVGVYLHTADTGDRNGGSDLPAAAEPRARVAPRDVFKRLLDLAGSLALLVVFSPVFLAIGALVKLTSRGPVFFRQVRIGDGGRPFTMLKFRTMQVNADQAIHQQYVTQFITANSAASNTDDAPFKIVNDPRVTPIGRFLRRTSLDELPQFWNVLRGDMSLVGPRPPLPYEVEQYKAWHYRRVLDAKPGITGLWQVKGRSRTTFDEMVRLDLRYARTYSVWADVKILLATPRAVISGKGAC